MFLSKRNGIFYLWYEDEEGRGKKLRRHLTRTRKGKGLCCQRWSRQWPYATLGLFNQCLVQ